MQHGETEKNVDNQQHCIAVHVNTPCVAARALTTDAAANLGARDMHVEAMDVSGPTEVVAAPGNACEVNVQVLA